MNPDELARIRNFEERLAVVVKMINLAGEALEGAREAAAKHSPWFRWLPGSPSERLDAATRMIILAAKSIRNAGESVGEIKKEIETLRCGIGREVESYFQ